MTPEVRAAAEELFAYRMRKSAQKDGQRPGMPPVSTPRLCRFGEDGRPFHTSVGSLQGRIWDLLCEEGVMTQAEIRKRFPEVEARRINEALVGLGRRRAIKKAKAPGRGFQYEAAKP